MNSAIRKTAAWSILTAIFVTQVGCGAGGKAKVTGRVTLGGQPVENGYITFFPEDNHGTTAMTEIVEGDYKIGDLVPGKKRIYVTITGQGESVTEDAPPAGKSRREANAERLGERKKRRTASQQAAFKIEGNNSIYDIPSGSHQIDIPLEKVGAGK